MSALLLFARACLVAAEVFFHALLQHRKELPLLQVLLIGYHQLACVQAADAELLQHTPAHHGWSEEELCLVQG